MGQMTITRRRQALVGALAATVSAVVLLAFAAFATADLSFCPPGSGAGECSKPQGVAVDTSSTAPSSGHLYVADGANNRINVFDSSGAFLFAFGWGVADGTTSALQSCTATCFEGIDGAGVGQFSGPRRVAVDNDPASPSFHDVYVFDSDNFRVQKFDPEGHFLLAFGSKGTGPGQFNDEVDQITVGPGGAVYVADMPKFEQEPRVEKFNPSGGFLEAVPISHQDRMNGGFAVDSSGDMYASFNKGGGIFKFHPDGSQYGAPYPLDPNLTFGDCCETGPLAIDGADRLFAGQAEGRKEPSPRSPLKAIAVYDSAGTTLQRFGYGKIGANLLGVAPYPAPAADVFGSVEGEGIIALPFPPPGPIVAPPSVEADPVGNTKATLAAEINPEGKTTEYHFEFVDQEGYEAQGESFTGPATKSSPSATVAMPAKTEFNLHYVKTQIGCLEPVTEAPEGKCLNPETTYHFRIVAGNADGPGEGEVEGEFTTKAPLQIEDTWAAEVGTDTAVLHVEANPLGVLAGGFFEYVADAAFKASGFATAKKAPDIDSGASPISLGSGEAAVERSASLYPLAPGTTYHYRFVAEDPFVTITGPAFTFTTFVPQQPNVNCPNQQFRISFSAALPDCRAYEMVSPVDKNNGDVLVLEEGNTHAPAMHNQSSISGARFTYSSYRSFGNPQSAPWTSQYMATRGPDGWANEAISPPRSVALVAFFPAFDTEYKFFSPDLCFSWLRTVSDPPLAPGAIEGFPNLYKRDDCGGGGYEALTTATPPHASIVESPFPAEHFGSLQLQGVTADGAHAFFAVTENLTPDAPDLGGKGLQLYESTGGDLRFLCILSDGKATKLPCYAGTARDSYITGGGGGYRRAIIHNAVSADGRRVFWTEAKLGGGAGTDAGTIYLRVNPDKPQSNVSAGECTQPARACTYPVSATASAGAATFQTAAADGSVAIFSVGDELYEFDTAAGTSTLIAKGMQGGLVGAGEDAARLYFASTEVLDAGASAGKPNLYLYQRGVGFRFIVTLSPIDTGSDFYPKLIAREPYKHTTRTSADGRHLVFMSSASPTGYDNTDARSGKADAEVYLYDADSDRLLCASCNPTDSRPLGANINGPAEPYWAAGQISGWTNGLYAPRNLAEDGSRLFFESADALLVTDTNGATDVYQWEAPGSGDCEAQSPAFSPLNEGCVSLISSGKSLRDSSFLDADPSGDDVFIATLGNLLPQDDGLIDVYDARVGGGYPPPPGPPATCEGDACQSPCEAPNDPTPASAAFKGSGNAPGKRATRRCRRAARAAKRPGGRSKHAKRCHRRSKANANRGGAK